MGSETRMYLRTGHVVHRVPFNELGPLDCAIARCGLQPDLFQTWLGSGTQDEYDKAAQMRLCKRCEVAP